MLNPLTKFLASTIGRIAIAVVIGLVLLIAFKSCTGARQEASQARQDAKGSEAYAGAAEDAVATVVASGAAERAVDDVVNDAVKEIDNAKDPQAARAATLAAVCGLRLYHSRPECAVRRPDPENVE